MLCRVLKKLRKITQKQIRERNPTKERTRSANWRINNPERHLEVINKRRFKIDSRIKGICTAAKTRAKITGRNYSIDYKIVIEILNKQGNKCAITGLDFDLSNHEIYHRNPLGPSIDRIDSNKGYTPDNIQIVCVFYNCMKSEWSNEDLKYFIKIVYNSKICS